MKSLMSDYDLVATENIANGVPQTNNRQQQLSMLDNHHVH